MSEWERRAACRTSETRELCSPTHPRVHQANWHEPILVVPNLRTYSERKSRLEISGSATRIGVASCYRCFGTARGAVYVVQHLRLRRARYMVQVTLHRRPRRRCQSSCIHCLTAYFFCALVALGGLDLRNRRAVSVNIIYSTPFPFLLDSNGSGYV
ncbi:hypothetical protein GYMLUDRAFT_493652 [Collybiopsis luxurians FD-317 M1]|uniref:Uncharacterized protein n=1 Tax=Collybiopsis luxurians FD-317 M1 TaxID=944289 RepID=A0A0D0BL08_9AGAR|nr:hypothetical protein GYMLUDRAFT_493652 [Collybiopsis luxurians FD-317 M1]